MLYNIVKKEIIKNKELKDSGKFNGVPMPFPRLSEYIPTIAEKGESIGFLAATGAGKSKSTRYMFIYHPYKFAKEYNYPLKIIYFPLEDNKEKIMKNMMCHYLYELYGIYITLNELDSKGGKSLPLFVLEKIEEAIEFFKDFEKIVTLVDGKNQPTEIYKTCEEYALKNGVIKEYEVELNGNIVKQKRYIADNDVHTIVIVDNMSNIDQEENQIDERRSVVHFCRNLVRGRLCNFFKFTVVQVLQQDFQTERQSFTKEGTSIVAKLEPSLAAIGDSKTIARSMHKIYGLFHPVRYNIPEYPVPNKYSPTGYKLDILGNRFRALMVLKSNDTDFGQKLALDFDAVTENIKELPPIESPELELLYEKIKQKQPEKFRKISSVQPVYDDEDLITPF